MLCNNYAKNRRCLVTCLRDMTARKISNKNGTLIHP